MPSGNRVERLENQVQQLQATVEGLTEELVEANERIRQLESALSGDPEGMNDDAELSEGSLSVGGDDDLASQFEIESGADPEEVAAAAQEAVADGDAADTTKSDDDGSGDEGENDDIIVA